MASFHPLIKLVADLNNLENVKTDLSSYIVRMTVGGEERILSMEFSYNNYGGGLIANYTRPSISCIDKFTGERVTILKTTDTYSYAIALNNETIYTTMLGLAIYDKAGEWRLITKAKYRVSYSYYDDQFIKIAEGKIMRLSIRSLNRAPRAYN